MLGFVLDVTMTETITDLHHCLKSIQVRDFSGPHFSGFGLNTERYGVL